MSQKSIALISGEEPVFYDEAVENTTKLDTRKMSFLYYLNVLDVLKEVLLWVHIQ